MDLSLKPYYLICISRNQKQLTRAFEPTNHRNLSTIGHPAYNFIPGPARVSHELSSYSAICYCHFDTGKDQIIRSHFLEEMRDCKFIIALPNLLSETLNDRQATLSTPQRHFLNTLLYQQVSYHSVIHIKNKKALDRRSWIGVKPLVGGSVGSQMCQRCQAFIFGFL